MPVKQLFCPLRRSTHLGTRYKVTIISCQYEFSIGELLDYCLIFMPRRGISTPVRGDQRQCSSVSSGARLASLSIFCPIVFFEEGRAEEYRRGQRDGEPQARATVHYSAVRGLLSPARWASTASAQPALASSWLTTTPAPQMQPLAALLNTGRDRRQALAQCSTTPIPSPPGCQRPADQQQTAPGCHLPAQERPQTAHGDGFRSIVSVSEQIFRRLCAAGPDGKSCRPAETEITGQNRAAQAGAVQVVVCGCGVANRYESVSPDSTSPMRQPDRPLCAQRSACQVRQQRLSARRLPAPVAATPQIAPGRVGGREAGVPQTRRGLAPRPVQAPPATRLHPQRRFHPLTVSSSHSAPAGKIPS